MRHLLVTALLASAASLVLVGARAEDSANVLVLTDDNFESTLADVPVALVEFYAPWCGHCKSLAPKYDAAADQIAADPELKSSGAALAKMDADAEKKIPGKYGISGFPTLKLFRNGQFSEDFEGGRTTEDIVAYLRKKAAVAVNKEVTTLSALKTLTAAKTCPRTTVVGFFASKASVDYKIFASVAAQFASSGIDVYHTVSPAVLEGFGFFSGGSAVVMYRPGQKPFKLAYRGTIFKQQLSEWFMSGALPSFGAEYSPETEGLFRQLGLSFVRFVVQGASTPAAYQKAVPLATLEALSKKHPTIRFAYASRDHYKADAEAHCDRDVAVCVLATEGPKAKRGKGRTFGSTGAFSAASAEKFVDDFVAGSLKVKVKSEPAPAVPPKAGEVAHVVGTTFESIVADDSKDVLIEFYAPWCGHCKALAPKYDQLAKELEADFDSLAIAKFDMTANDIPGDYARVFAVQGFPTLYFAKKGSKMAPVKYEGSREVEAFKTWLAENRSK